MVSSLTSSVTACWNICALKAGRWQKHFLDERIHKSITEAVTVCCDSTRNRIRKYTGRKTYTQPSGTRYSSHLWTRKASLRGQNSGSTLVPQIACPVQLPFPSLGLSEGLIWDRGAELTAASREGFIRDKSQVRATLIDQLYSPCLGVVRDSAGVTHGLSQDSG